MSVATTRSGHTSTTQIPVLTPMYGGQRESFRAITDGTYRCGADAENEFRLKFSGAEPSHCCFVCESGEFSVHRLDGRVWVNDLLVNGKSVLNEGDVVSFGPVSFRLDLLEAPSQSFEPAALTATRVSSEPAVDVRLISEPVTAKVIVPVAEPVFAVPVEKLPDQAVMQSFVTAAIAEEKAAVTALKNELDEHQALLKLRQQQLDEVAQMVTERERLVNARLDTLETRSEQITVEWKEVRQKQERLDALETAITKRSAEVDLICQKLAEQQRQIETAAEQNAASVAAIEQSRQELAAREPELVQRDLELKAKAESLANQQQELAERAKTLADSEQRVASIAAGAVETRSVAQLSAIAAKQEAAIRERELALQAQNELQRLEKSVAASRLELERRQAEMESRESEISARLLALKVYRNQLRETQTLAVATAPVDAVVGTPDAAELQALAEEMRAERAELDRRAAEIAAAEECVSEQMNSALSMALTAESERNALHDANKDLLCERNSLSQLRQDLASRESGITEREVLVVRQLEDLRSRFAVLDLRAAELKQHESEVDNRAADVHRRVQQLKADRLAERESAAGKDLIVAAETTNEIQAIRQQLAELQETLAASENERSDLASERDSLLSAVRELQKALMDAREDLEDANRVKNDSAANEQRLAQAQQDLDDREVRLQSLESQLLLVTEELEKVRSDAAAAAHELDEVKMKMAEVASPNHAMPSISTPAFNDGESFAQLSRELDQRAELLDQREEALRERDRKIEQAEGDVDSQRRQLLEARQQLELARAEIQVAMRRQSESATIVIPPVPGSAIGSDVTHEQPVPLATVRVEYQDSESDLSGADSVHSSPVTDLRSELAGLFGLKKPATDKVTPPPVPQTEFMDLSEPTGENKAVAFHFGAADTQLAVTSSGSVSTPDVDAESQREENSDDFVRDYMEQLLSRNRKSAGAVLPGELKAADKKNEPQAAPAKANADKSAAKPAPKVKSFIEQYMAGNMGDLFNGEALTMTNQDSSTTVLETEVDERPTAPRQKMDLQKLKENMDSFRTLSTQSVENALASHAIKQERVGFSGRTVFAGVLLAMTLLLGIANGYGAINSPMLTWVTLTAAIGILSELYRRYTVIKIHTRSPLDLLFDSSKPKELVRPESFTEDSAATKLTSAPVAYEHVPVNSENIEEAVTADSDTVSIS